MWHHEHVFFFHSVSQNQFQVLWRYRFPHPINYFSDSTTPDCLFTFTVPCRAVAECYPLPNRQTENHVVHDSRQCAKINKSAYREARFVYIRLNSWPRADSATLYKNLPLTAGNLVTLNTPPSSRLRQAYTVVDCSRYPPTTDLADRQLFWLFTNLLTFLVAHVRC